MTPLHTFGDCNQYGFDVTDAFQIVIMKLKGEKWSKCDMESVIQEEINRNGGVDATVEMLFAIRRSQTPSGEPYRTSTQKREDERAKRVEAEAAQVAKAKADKEKKAAEEEAKNEAIREARAKKMAKDEAKRKLRAKKSAESIEAEAAKEVEEEVAKAAKKSKKKKK